MAKPNHFDQASRYLTKLDAVSFLRWLWGEDAERHRFRRWLDTRTIPFPGHPERTCDTVAELLDDAAFFWAFVVEFQTKPDPQMFGRLLEYLGRLWRELRPNGEDKPYHVAAAVVNLTGQGRTSQEMIFNSHTRTVLAVTECNMADLDAASLLADIASGQHAKALLPWIPLMRGGNEPGIIAQWKEIAQQEPHSQRRSDYGGLAVVLADLVDARPIWKQALEGWNVEQSAQVLEWEAKAAAKATLLMQQEALLRLLKGRFKKIPPSIINKIKDTADLTQLAHWFDAAININSLKEFRQLLES